MSYTHSLYYPSIDIEDLGWLKNAILYWDKISTIVPHHMMYKPYNIAETIELSERGILVPLEVSPNHQEVKKVTEKALAYYIENNENLSHLNTTKPLKSKIFEEKMSWELLNELIALGKAHRSHGEIRVESGFANFYMSLLAAELSLNKRLALLTPLQLYEEISSESRRIDILSSHPKQILVGTMAKFIINEMVSISPDTPLIKILKFRERHADELSLFRRKLYELASEISLEEIPTQEALNQIIKDKYINEVEPSINQLKLALKGHRIDTLLGVTKSIFFFSSVPFLANKIDTTLAAVISIGFSLNLDNVNYLNRRQLLLKESPFSYVFIANNNFRKRTLRFKRPT